MGDPSAIKLAAGRLLWQARWDVYPASRDTNEAERALARPPIW